MTEFVVQDKPRSLLLLPATTHQLSLILKKAPEKIESDLSQSKFVVPPFNFADSRKKEALDFKNVLWELSEHGKLHIKLFLSSQNRTTQSGILHYVHTYAKLISKSEISEQKYRFSDGFDKNIGYFNFLEDQKYGWAVQRCIKHGSLHECPKDGLNVFKANLCGVRKLCVICGDKYTRALAGQSMKLINAISEVVKGLNLISIVFTLPESVQEITDYKNFGRFSRACKKTMYKYHNGLMPAGLFSSHTWHSKTPLKEWYPHNHTLWLNLVYDKKKSNFSMTDSYLNRQRLHNIYRGELVKEFPECFIPKKVNFKIEYVPVQDSTRGKIWHKFLYALRMPQIDVIKYSNNHNLTEYSDSEKNHLSNILLTPKNWRRSRWFGWLADGVKSRYLKLLNLNPEDFKKDEEKPDIDVRCPVCHSVCEMSEEFVTIEGLKKDKISFLYPWDPGGGLS